MSCSSNFGDKLLKECVKIDRQHDRELDLIAFESFLQKFKFINSLTINYLLFILNSSLVLELIAKHCINLRNFFFVFNETNEKSLLEFGIKCGSKLKEITFIGTSNINNDKWIEFMRFCPNIVSIEALEFEKFISGDEILFPKLMKVDSSISSKDEEIFKCFAHNL
jgi:hypothetical protein